MTAKEGKIQSKKLVSFSIGCYICEKKGHFARECRYNRNGIKKIIQEWGELGVTDHAHDQVNRRRKKNEREEVRVRVVRSVVNIRKIENIAPRIKFKKRKRNIKKLGNHGHPPDRCHEHLIFI
jgi:hypothetical protein